MSEQEIREGMLLAVWDEPPLDFDPDTLIRRVEQKKSRRRALVAVGVATAVIAVASFALPGLLPRDRNSQLASESETNTSAPAPQKSQQELQRIGDQLSQKLAKTVPSLQEQVYATFRRGAFVPGVPSTSSTTEPPLKQSEPEITGYVYLTDDIGPTALHVEAGRSDFSAADFCKSASFCHELSQKDGSVVTEAEFNEGGPDITRSEAVRRFQSGFSVRIVSYNYNPASGRGLRQTVPVRVGVLTTLVTEPGIDWE